MKISVIIPTLNEGKNIISCIKSINHLNPYEIIVSDGGSSDDTCTLARQSGAKVIQSPKGRGIQLKKGASEARGDVFLFLHADAELSKDVTLDDFTYVLREGFIGGFFRLKFDAKGLSVRLVEFFANLRSRLFSLPYGDQAIFITKKAYEDVGGFREYPFLEDIDIVLRLKRIGRLKMINKPVTVSARRIERGFVFSPIIVSLRNVLIAVLFLVGFKPKKLVRLYR